MIFSTNALYMEQNEQSRVVCLGLADDKVNHIYKMI